MIYFIFSEVDPEIRVKIGYAKNDVHKRMKDLQIGSPLPLRLIMAIEGDRRQEKQLHARFGRSRSHGEWFYPTKDLQDYIQKVLGWTDEDIKNKAIAFGLA